MSNEISAVLLIHILVRKEIGGRPVGGWSKMATYLLHSNLSEDDMPPFHYDFGYYL